MHFEVKVKNENYELENKYSLLKTWGGNSINKFLQKFIQHHARPDNEYIFVIPQEKCHSLIKLLDELIKFNILNSLDSHTNAFSGTIIDFANQMEHDSIEHIIQIISDKNNDLELYEKFKDKIKIGRAQGGYSYDMLYHLVKLLTIREQKNHQELPLSSCHLEHILPENSWKESYPEWKNEEYNNNLYTLGNMVLLEGELNQLANNKAFRYKKDEYKKSKINSVQNLCNINNWTPDEWKTRDNKCKETLLEWFKPSVIIPKSQNLP